MLPCDLIFYKRASLINRLISWVTKSEYTHVALALNANEIIEANVFVKTRVVTFDVSEEVVIKRMPNLTEEEAKIILDYTRSKLGTKYDYLTVIKKGFQLLLKRDRAIIDDDTKVFCSEVVDRAYSAAGIDLVPEKVAGDVTPYDLFLSKKLVTG